MQRQILHSDLNSFYASVEMMLAPSLRGKAVAVCGSTEERHGIVLAKSELAKKAGVKTGMANWEARRLCPGLIICPPQFEQYIKYSKLVRAIYQRYTDKIEPFGMDECWLDVSDLGLRSNDGEKIAQEIRKSVRDEIGITVSIGVSFNKIFAKLGSDMNKPDAVTVIGEEDYKEKVWPLPASDLIYAGRATTRKLSSYGINTIGDIAQASPEFLKRLLGVNGIALWRFASGADQSRVMDEGFTAPVKSVGHGITCVGDLKNENEVWKVMLELSQDIGRRLRLYELRAKGVQLTVKDNALMCRQYQAQLEFSTKSPLELAEKARELFAKNYAWTLPVRAVTVRAINLVPEGLPQQADLFNDILKREKLEKLDDAVDDLRRRFGKRAIYPASLMGDIGMPGRGINEITMPGTMYS